MSRWPTFKTLLYDLQDGIATVTLNRPEVRNAINDEMRHDFRTLSNVLAADQAIRVVIFTGAGEEAFSAGGDISLFEQEWQTPAFRTAGGLGFGHWDLGFDKRDLGFDKRMTLREAVARYVPDGASVVLGAPLESLIPFSAGHEIIRQGKRDLTLVGPISDMLFDQIVGAGCARRIIAAWVGNVSAGLGHNYRRAVEQGIPHPIEIQDHSNFTIALALLAGGLGAPYIPTYSVLGTDLLRTNPTFKESTSPFGGEKVLLVPALQPDVAVLNVQRSDPEGNAHCWGNLGISEEAALASKGTILVAEEIVSREVILSDPNRVLAPKFKVLAVVHEPGGAHPSPVQGYYNRDHEAYHAYHRKSRTLEGFQAWLERWVLDVGDRAEYLERLGVDRWRRLASKDRAFAAPVDYGY